MGRYNDEQPVEHPHFVREKVAEYEGEIINELTKLDLSPNEAKILLYLMIYNNSTASQISRLSGIQRTETYHYLRSLLAKGAVRITFDRPQRYYGLPYKEAVEHLVNVKMSSLNSVAQKKEHYHGLIAQILDNIVQKGQIENDVYQVIVGKEPLVAKLQKMIQDAKQEITLLLTVSEMMILYHNNLMDEMSNAISRGIRVNIMTDSPKVQEYVNNSETTNKMPVRVINSTGLASCIIFDGEDMITFVESSDEGFKSAGPRVFYTNNKKLISVFKVTLDKS